MAYLIEAPGSQDPCVQVSEVTARAKYHHAHAGLTCARSSTLVDFVEESGNEPHA